MGALFDLFALLVGPVIAYWFIRHAVYGAMKDFEQWKRKQYGGSDYDNERPMRSWGT